MRISEFKPFFVGNIDIPKNDNVTSAIVGTNGTDDEGKKISKRMIELVTKEPVETAYTLWRL